MGVELVVVVEVVCVVVGEFCLKFCKSEHDGPVYH